MKRRASTDGCTEWTCMYHGDLNRFKSGHEKHCPIFQDDGVSIMDALTDPENYTGPRCSCAVAERKEDDRPADLKLYDGRESLGQRPY